MDIDKIIESLNAKLKAVVGEPDLDKMNLSEDERALVKTYDPRKSFVIYGTLAPNRRNHAVIEHIHGKWQKGIVRGKLVKKGWGAELGYYGFKPVRDEEQEEVEAFILTSDELAENWAFLDDFEGSEYKRILAKYELENGEPGVGYIYAANDEP